MVAGEGGPTQLESRHGGGGVEGAFSHLSLGPLPVRGAGP